MPEQLLNRPDIITILQQVGRKRMAQSVGTCRLGKSSFPHGLFHRFLQERFVKMVPPLFSSDFCLRNDRLQEISTFFIPARTYRSSQPEPDSNKTIR
jgi:hypothetical protein